MRFSVSVRNTVSDLAGARAFNHFATYPEFLHTLLLRKSFVFYLKNICYKIGNSTALLASL